MQKRRKPRRGNGGASERFENRTFNSRQQLENSDFQTEKSRPPDKISLHAELIGDHTCTALDITARGAAPVLTLCRKLIEVGHDPATPLEVYRSDVLCLRVRSIGEGANLEINAKGTGFNAVPAVRTASPMRQTASAALQPIDAEIAGVRR